ncbi:MAG: nucleoside hydrolase [Phycisphaerae bacterium]
MAIPVLIDTDAGADGVVALALVLASDQVDLRAITGVAGSVDLDQVMANLDRLLDALGPPSMPIIGRGLDQVDSSLLDRRALFGDDGLSNWEQTAKSHPVHDDFLDVYQRTIEEASGALNILALGPLSNLAALVTEMPDSARHVEHVFISGGSVWARGNVNEFAEFNFYRDPSAAAVVLTSGLPITIVPLDVTGLVCLDQSHVARMAASGYRTGDVAARVLEHALEYDGAPTYGKVFAPAAVTVGSLLWPDLFIKTRMRLDVTTRGAEAGRSRPALGGDKTTQVDLLTAVNAMDLLENMLECLCHEAFIV